MLHCHLNILQTQGSIKSCEITEVELKHADLMSYFWCVIVHQFFNCTADFVLHSDILNNVSMAKEFVNFGDNHETIHKLFGLGLADITDVKAFESGMIDNTTTYLSAQVSMEYTYLFGAKLIRSGAYEETMGQTFGADVFIAIVALHILSIVYQACKYKLQTGASWKLAGSDAVIDTVAATAGGGYFRSYHLLLKGALVLTVYNASFKGQAVKVHKPDPIFKNSDDLADLVEQGKITLVTNHACILDFYENNSKMAEALKTNPAIVNKDIGNPRFYIDYLCDSDRFVMVGIEIEANITPCQLYSLPIEGEFPVSRLGGFVISKKVHWKIREKLLSVTERLLQPDNMIGLSMRYLPQPILYPLIDFDKINNDQLKPVKLKLLTNFILAAEIAYLCAFVIFVIEILYKK